MCKLFLPQRTGRRVEHGSEVDGGPHRQKRRNQEKEAEIRAIDCWGLDREGLLLCIVSSNWSIPSWREVYESLQGSAICEAQEGQKSYKIHKAHCQVIKAVMGLGERRVLGNSWDAVLSVEAFLWPNCLWVIHSLLSDPWPCSHR